MEHNEYQRGLQIGELIGEIKSLRLDIQSYSAKQDKWNEKMDERVTIAEEWIQTTTGKVIILTAVFGIIGSVFYIGVNWLISHFNLK